jgi:fucose 4-O-acetylase-like acetyltransferase
MAHSDRSEASAGLNPRADQRLLWLDVAKGGGIVLVVFGHALGGLLDSPLGAHQDGLRALFLAIYIVHMPLFFLLSGLTVHRRLDRGWKRQLGDLAISIAYPYFLWSTVQYSAIYAAGSLVNSPVEHFWRPLLKLPISTISQFWFLYILFFLHLTATLLVPRIGARAFLGLAIAGRIGLALFGMVALPSLFVTHGLFYALGLWLGTQGIEQLRHRIAGRGWMIAGIVAIVLAAEIGTVWAVIAARGPDFATLESREVSVMALRLPVVPMSLAAIFVCLLLSMRARGWLADALAFLGQRSMAIFVLHVLFIAGSRIALTRIAHVHEPAILLAAGTALGLLMPLLLYALAHRLKLVRLLGLGG